MRLRQWISDKIKQNESKARDVGFPIHLSRGDAVSVGDVSFVYLGKGGISFNSYADFKHFYENSVEVEQRLPRYSFLAWLFWGEREYDIVKGRIPWGTP